MNRLDSLQILRGVAAIMVVLFHAHIYVLPEKISAGAKILNAFNMGYAGVEIFFVISGFIMWKVHAGDLGMPQRMYDFIFKRVVRIYPVYWVVFFALVLLYFIFPGSGSEGARDISQILWGASLLPMPHNPVMEIAWTLQHEVFFYVLFALLIFSRKIGALIFVFWMGGCIVNLFCTIDSFSASFVFSAYNLLFPMGMAVAALVKKQCLSRIGIICAIGTACFLAIGLVEAYGLIEWHKPLRTVLYGLTAGMMMTVTALSLQRLPSFFILIGNASYSIYLIHMPAMLIVVKLLAAVSLFTLLPPFLSFILITLAAVASGIMFHVVVEGPMLGYLARFRPRQNVLGPT